MNNKAIGVFDSGIGGLTVLDDLKKNFPNENFLYFGDTARCPYGTKSKELLEKIVESDVRYFEKNDVKMVVIACNTATANSYHIEAKMPIIRIIGPCAEKAMAKKVEIKSNKPIAVLATNYTVNSKAYNKFLGDDVIGVCCSEWVDIIESGKTHTEESKASVEKLLKDIKGKVDIIILGCTHFGLLEEEIREYLGKIEVVNSSLSLTDKVKSTLDEVGYNMGDANTVINISGDKHKLNTKPFENTSLDLKLENINEIEIE